MKYFRKWDALNRDITASIRVRSPATKGAKNLFFALRMEGLGCGDGNDNGGTGDNGLFLWLTPNSNAYKLTYDISRHFYLYDGAEIVHRILNINCIFDF